MPSSKSEKSKSRPGPRGVKRVKSAFAKAGPERITPQLKRRARRISAVLRKIYGARGTALNYKGPYQLLVATVLSAQCTDEMVNRVTPVLFAAHPTAEAMMAAGPERIEKIIHSTGFFRQKARCIVNLSKAIMERFGGEVPESMEDLTSLPGVGRKTANLVRAMVFGHPGLIVDTHFRRLAQRLGLAETDDPARIEIRLAGLLPPGEWTEFSNSMIWHGRALCTARAPRCAECPVLKDCPTGNAGCAAR